MLRQRYINMNLLIIESVLYHLRHINFAFELNALCYFFTFILRVIISYCNNYMVQIIRNWKNITNARNTIFVMLLSNGCKKQAILRLL